MTTYLPAILILFLTLNVHAQGTVILTVENIQLEKGGEISAGIFPEETFPKVGRQLVGREVEVTGKRMQIVFEEVPAGSYGIVAFQDIDKNKDLKTNFLGFPREPIGFSNDAKIKMGPPDFEDARVTLADGQTLEVTISLK